MEQLSRLKKQSKEEFNPLETLSCRYLRLSDSNVQTLERLCAEDGVDVGIHPHTNTEKLHIGSEIISGNGNETNMIHTRIDPHGLGFILDNQTAASKN